MEEELFDNCDNPVEDCEQLCDNCDNPAEYYVEAHATNLKNEEQQQCLFTRNLCEGCMNDL